MNAVRETVAPSARWVLAFRRESNLPWSEGLAEVPAAIQERMRSPSVVSVLKEAESTGEVWEKSLQTAGWRVQRTHVIYEDRRRLTPSQARAWMLRAAERPQSYVAAARAVLSPQEWEQWLASAGAYFSGGARDFRACLISGCGARLTG